MESLMTRSGGLLAVAIVATLLATLSADFGFSVHLGIIAAAAMLAMIFTLKNASYDPLRVAAGPDGMR